MAGRFKTHVPINAGNGLTQYVSTADVAAEVMRSWGKAPRVYRQSYPVVIAAIEGKATADEAREAFRLAAKEARVLRGDHHKSSE